MQNELNAVLRNAVALQIALIAAYTVQFGFPLFFAADWLDASSYRSLPSVEYRVCSRTHVHTYTHTDNDVCASARISAAIVSHMHTHAHSHITPSNAIQTTSRHNYGVIGRGFASMWVRGGAGSNLKCPFVGGACNIMMLNAIIGKVFQLRVRVRISVYLRVRGGGGGGGSGWRLCRAFSCHDTTKYNLTTEYWDNYARMRKRMRAYGKDMPIK